MVEGLRDLGLAIHVACFEGQPAPGVPFHRLGNLPPSADRRYALAVPRLAQLMRRLRPRVVHGVFVSSYGLMTALAHAAAFGARPDVPLIQTALGTDLLVRTRRSRRRALLARFSLRRATLLTGNSAALRREAARLAPATPWHRFVWGPPRALLDGERTREPIVVSNRRLEPSMRVDRICRAFRESRARRPEALHGWRLVVTNAGSGAAEVRAAADGDPCIEFVGSLAHAELHALLLRASVMVSIPESDSTSAALMDALAAGLVPVVGGLPAPLEWVDPSIAEIVDPDPTVAELAEAIGRAAQRQVAPALVRERVRDIVWEDELERLASVYRRLGSSAAVRPDEAPPTAAQSSSTDERSA